MKNLTKHQLPRKRMFKLLIKLFPLFLLLFLVSNCTEEYIDIQDESLQKGSLFKNELSQEQRIIELAEGIKPKIKDYNNQYKKPKKFQRKYGIFDTDNIKIINLPQFNDDLLIIIPFKNNQKKFKKNNEKKEKLFIAYYKDGKKTYTVLRNKNYKKKLRSSTEEGFLTHLEIMFKYVYGNIPPGVNKTLAMKTEYCPWITLMIDQKTCTALEFNKCTGLYRTVDLVEDGWDCNAEELEEIELDVPETCPDGYEENDYGVCVPKKNTGDPDKDPDKDPDDDCDDLAFDCDKGGGIDDPGDNPTDEPCDPGQVKDGNGNCVKVPCVGDHKANPLENLQVLGSKNNGITGGLYGYGRGKFHDGIDLTASVGTPIHAMFDGYVGKTVNNHIQGEDWADVENWNYDKNGAGNRIYISSKINGDDIQLGYWHLSQVAMNLNTGKSYKTGDQVRQGEIIGYVGTTGNATSNSSAGPHLHLRGRRNGQKIDPLNYILSDVDLTTGKGAPCN